MTGGRDGHTDIISYSTLAIIRGDTEAIFWFGFIQPVRLLSCPFDEFHLKNVALVNTTGVRDERLSTTSSSAPHLPVVVYVI